MASCPICTKCKQACALVCTRSMHAIFLIMQKVSALCTFCFFYTDNQTLKQCIHIYTPSALASARTWFPCHHLRSNTLLAPPLIRSQTDTRTGIGGEIFQTEQAFFLTPITVFSPSHNNACGYPVPISPCLHKGSHQSADSADKCRQVQTVSTRLII